MAEKYIGAITSGSLSRIKSFKDRFVPGYALYATTKRLIGVDKKREVAEEEGGGLIGFYSAYKISKRERSMISRLEEDKSGEAIKELLKSKDIEISKEDISHIQIKKPGHLLPGFLKILMKSGEEIEIKLLAHSGIFEQVGQLMQAFYPEVIEQID